MSAPPGAEARGVEVHAEHPDRHIEPAAVRTVVLAVCAGENVVPVSVGVILGDHALVRGLHREWMGLDTDTDVLSFVLDEDAQAAGRLDGEVYVDLDTAWARAPEFGTTPEREALRYVAHGVLHLAGHDDATAEQRAGMRTLEDRYLDAAGV